LPSSGGKIAKFKFNWYSFQKIKYILMLNDIYSNKNQVLPTPITEGSQKPYGSGIVVFIDSGVDEYWSLVDGADPESEVIILDANEDGVLQITKALRGRTDIKSIHLVSHGSPGCLYLGNTQLSLDTLDFYTSQLITWKTSLSSTPLLLYGCNVAAGNAGTQFLSRINQLTGATIAASVSYTGNALLGGNWELEVTNDKSEVSLVFSEEVRKAYPSVLAARLSLGDTSVTEGNSGVVNAIFPVTLDNRVSGGVSVDFYTVPNTAQAQFDVGVAPIGTGSLVAGTLDSESGDFFFIGRDSATLYRYNIPTNTRTSITIPRAINYGDLAFNTTDVAISSNGIIYGSGTDYWWTLDPNDPSTYKEVPRDISPDANNKIGFGLDGTLYGQANVTDRFGTVNPSTGLFTEIISTDATIRLGEISNATLNSVGEEVIYGTGGSNIYEVNVATGEQKLVSSSVPVTDVNGTEWDPLTGQLYYAGWDGSAFDIYTWDPDTDTHTLVKNNLDTTGTLNFSGNAGEIQRFSIPVFGDTIIEPNENFFAYLTNIRTQNGDVTFADNMAVGTIIDDDASPPPSSNLEIAIDGNPRLFPVKSYGDTQDVNAIATVSADNKQVKIDGNGWKGLNIGNRNITGDTRLRFEFKSNGAGEILGVHFDNDGIRNNEQGRFFKLAGSETHGIPNFKPADYIIGSSGDGFSTYEIPVGDFFTGQMSFLTLRNDHDVANPTASSQYRNIELFEEASPPPSSNLEIAIDGNPSLFPVKSYGDTQDVNAIATVSADNKQVKIDGNGWKGLNIGNRNITANTRLRFEFKSNGAGEILGVHFDNDGIRNNEQGRFFKLAGSETFGIPNFKPADYIIGSSGDGFSTYEIPVGDFFTGQMSFLTLRSDHDVANPTASSQYRNIKLFEEASPPPSSNLEIAIDGNPRLFPVNSYGDTQDVNAIATVSADNKQVKIDGNGWKGLNIGNRNITANTRLRFEFKSNGAGEILGVHFDNDGIRNNEQGRFFKLAGSETFGIPDFNATDYIIGSSGDGFSTYEIPVGDFFTGQMSFLTLRSDHDVANPTASSQYRNIELFDI
jgi:imidazole glycerol phosphate synthase subunit HisF